MKDTFSTSPMWLVYEEDSEGFQPHQPYADVVDVGTLVDPNTGDDLRIVGWTTEEPEEATVVLPNDVVREGLLEKAREYQTIHKAVTEHAEILRGIYEKRTAGDWTFEGVLGNFAQALGVW